MRWFWIDRFEEFISGRRAVARKCVTTAEPAVEEYLPGFPVFPSSLIIEGVAQTGGLLVGEALDFRERVVLAKVGAANFSRSVTPGDVMTYHVQIRDQGEDGSAVEAQVRVGDETVGEIDMMFAYLRDAAELGLPETMFPPDDFMVMLRLFRLFEVAQDELGRPRPVPQWLREAERATYPDPVTG